MMLLVMPLYMLAAQGHVELCLIDSSLLEMMGHMFVHIKSVVNIGSLVLSPLTLLL